MSVFCFNVSEPIFLYVRYLIFRYVIILMNISSASSLNELTAL